VPRAQRRRPRRRVRQDAAAESTRDGFAADDRDGTAGKGLGWWDGMIGPGKAFDTDHFFVVSTTCSVAAGHDRALVDRPGHRQALRVRTFPSSRSPTWSAPKRAFLDVLGIGASRRWPAGRWAGCRH
jgi:homoserine O-acetyltransferase